MMSPDVPAAAPARIGARTRVDAPLLLDVAVLLVFAALRTVGNDVLLASWVVVVLLLAIYWPASGLGLAAALVIFPQPARFGLTLSMALIAASAAGLATDLVRTGRPIVTIGRPTAIVVGGVVALTAATGVALVHSLMWFDREIAIAAARRWIEFGAGLSFFLLLLRAFSLGSKRPLVVGLIGISIGLAVSLVDTFAQSFLPSLKLGWLVSSADSSRATGPFVSPNRLGTVAGIVAIVGACQALINRKWRWPWATLAGLAMVALIISFSRGALFGLILAGGGILAMRSWRAAGAYAAVALALAIVAVPVIVSARLAGGGTFEILMENDQGRFNAWLAGIRMILAEPILGHGFYSFRVLGEGYGATDGLQTAHNDLVGLWAESGIVAAIAYVVTAFGIVACAMKRRTDPWAVASVGALTVFLVASSFNIQSMFLEVVGPLWLVVAYGIARPLDAARGRPSPTRQAAMGAAGHAINREYTEAAH